MKPRIDQNRMTMEVELIDDDGDEYTVKFPIVFKVCWRCEGKGSHVHPGVDGHGITESEWEQDWSFEEQEQYWSGGYDVQCEECHGANVLPAIDEKRCEELGLEGQLQRYQEEQQDLADMYAIEAAERRFGC